ncbi:MAG TPA: class I SAM-dependent methyltransferase, partial [Roseiflexaceae bacterium]|nr:class I SAM-dependent methyltransferase [Roseiflexaceae bacterium]
ASYPPHAHNPLMLAEERAMLELLPADLRRRSVLDAGCGSGRYLLHALRRGARRVLGFDLSAEMLGRARAELKIENEELKKSGSIANFQMIQANLVAMPIRDGWAELTICGLTIGHVERLGAALAELRRVTRPGGTILCSDFHPIGHALGWRREFFAGGQRYAVRHTPHLYADWQREASALGLRVTRVLEPYLDPADIPAGARFDPAALRVPVALVFELLREQ